MKMNAAGARNLTQQVRDKMEGDKSKFVELLECELDELITLHASKGDNQLFFAARHSLTDLDSHPDLQRSILTTVCNNLIENEYDVYFESGNQVMVVKW